MRRRSALAACCLAAGTAAAQPPRPDCDKPTELPPLLPVPADPGPPPPARPGPKAEFDPGYFYLPERSPEPDKVDRVACGPPGRWWVGADLTLGWTRGADLPPLVRLGDAAVYGGRRGGAPFRAGVGVNAGLWLDEYRERGVDAGFLYLSQDGTNSRLFAADAPLVLPTADGTGFPLADPAAGRAGAFEAGLTTRFAAADVNYRRSLLCSPDGRLDALVGYRYAHLGESFEVYGKRLGPGGAVVRFRDAADADNQFHGGQVGLAGEVWAGGWSAGGSAKVAFGTVFAETGLGGKFRVDGTVVPYGFYARPGLAGERDYTRFGVVPTVGLSLGRRLGEHARLTVGYQFLYANHFARAPDVIERTPNVSAAGPLRVLPAAPDRRDAVAADFWAQSVNLGLEVRY